MAQVQFTSNLAVVQSALKEQLEIAGEIIGGMMESHAKEHITDAVYQNEQQGWYIRTGALRNSITHSVEEEDGKTVVVVGTNVEYAPYVELGTGKYAKDGNGRKTPWHYKGSDGEWHTTSGMPPRPFLRPALENHKAEYMDVLKTELGGTGGDLETRD